MLYTAPKLYQLFSKI